MTDRKLQSPGRDRNEAQPLGQRHGLAGDGDTDRIGRSARRRPGPDGVPPDEIGDTFKQPPRGSDD